MRRRGSVSFVVEVMRRRFPQNGATTGDLDRKSGSRISPIGAGGSSVTPLIERERVSDPTIEAAKIAAKRFFSQPGSPQSARADHWSDPDVRGFVSRVEPARPADVAVQKPAGDLVASPPPQADGQAETPRSGRILQSLIVEDPLDALLRRNAEERSTRRRPRGPRAQSVIPNGTKATVPTDSQHIPAHKTPAKPSTDFTESAVSTDIVEPGRKLRGRTVVTDPNPAVDMPRDKTVRRRKKRATKAPRRAGSLRRTANERAGAKRRAQKRAASRSSGKKGVAKRAASKIGAGKVAVAKKTTVRKGGAKGYIGRPPLAKKRSAARRTVTTASGRKLASRKIAKTRRSAAGTTKKTKRSAAGTTKAATRSRQQATRRARRSR
jgi:hypothetical protein